MKTLFRMFLQVAVFDTAFHQSMPERAYIYGIPYSFVQKYGIRGTVFMEPVIVMSLPEGVIFSE